MIFLDEFTATFNEPGIDILQGSEDGIPYLTIYRTNEELMPVMSLDIAVRLAAKVQFALQCPVHFHQLQGDAISFFVFDGRRTWPAHTLEGYGVPLEVWLPAVQGHHIEPFESYGLDIDDATPTQAEGYGFIWARSLGFSSTSRSGKWCVVCSEDVVNDLWAKVCGAVKAGQLPAAIVSTRSQAASHGGTYVICAFNLAWSDISEVHRVRALLRDFGVSQDIGYKRDVDTVNNVYGTPDEWVFRA